ncbi:MAG: DNA replication/repair protein RecF [Actinobacteria bacterium]|nr:DNA replication/repair protein RecF [Actinomycetota bacterium]
MEFDKSSILLVGNNGNGKTNLLESIYYLSTGCSHRTHIQDELIKWGSDFSLIRACIGPEDGSKKYIIEIEIRKNNNIKIRINGVYQKKKSDFISIMPSVIFSPDDLRIIKSGPGERRTFLDSILDKTHRDFYGLRLQYQKILMQRNSLLKSIKAKAGDSQLSTISAWNENLIKYGIEIMERRLDLLDAIREKFREYAGDFFKGMDSGIEYIFSWDRAEGTSGYNDPAYRRPGGGNGKAGALSRNDLREIFLKKLNENFERDLTFKTTTTGPHRDDLIVFFDGRDIRSFGSQGQQRIASVSLKLCELHILKEALKTDPVLLLDDVLSELDIERRKKLVKVINERFQTFVTATNISYLDKLDIDFGSRFLVSGNSINEMNL